MINDKKRLEQVNVIIDREYGEQGATIKWNREGSSRHLRPK